MPNRAPCAHFLIFPASHAPPPPAFRPQPPPPSVPPLSPLHPRFIPDILTPDSSPTSSPPTVQNPRPSPSAPPPPPAPRPRNSPLRVSPLPPSLVSPSLALSSQSCASPRHESGTHPIRSPFVRHITTNPDREPARAVPTPCQRTRVPLPVSCHPCTALPFRAAPHLTSASLQSFPLPAPSVSPFFLRHAARLRRPSVASRSSGLRKARQTLTSCMEGRNGPHPNLFPRLASSASHSACLISHQHVKAIFCILTFCPENDYPTIWHATGFMA